MVLPDRIELSTSPLPMECSTTELRQRAARRNWTLDLKNRPKGAPQGGRSLPQGQRARKRGKSPLPAEIAAIGADIELAPCSSSEYGRLRSERAKRKMAPQASRSAMNDDRNAGGPPAGRAAKD